MMTVARRMIVCGAVTLCGSIAFGEARPLVPGFADFGTISSDLECTVFESISGQQFQIASAEKPLEVGQFVFVQGDVFDGPTIWCDQPVLMAKEIAPAISEYGTLVQGFECLIFQTQDGELYQIDPQVGFMPGDFVHVTAAVHICVSFCGLPCLTDAIVEPAFSGCGTITFGIECPLFVGDEGGAFLLIGVPGATIGNRLHVTGIVDPFCISFCFATCLEAEFFEDATADLNCDGVVNGIDLGQLLANWSIPAGSPGCGGGIGLCTSDLNLDGVVDGLDLGLLLASWSGV